MAVISLELNEVNFAFVKTYVERGCLPTFGRLLARHQLFETVSEKAYPHLEPWIQWPTVYTGKSYAEHGIFRLGDAVQHDHEQIWEALERGGASVGAVSPMNAANRCRSPDFFLPDPWTVTPVSADPRTSQLYALIRDLVNDNASSQASSVALMRRILPLAMPFLKPGSFARYLAILKTAIRHRWAKAAFLDSLLTDLFLGLMRRHGTQFGSLFLNSAAHIQHHHMFDSAVYQGERRNPGWYSSAADSDVDPLLFIYGVYDQILAQVLAVPDARVLITTGLSQVPNERDHYQYRIVDFAHFFQAICPVDAEIEPRMSRDFLLRFSDVAAAEAARRQLEAATCAGKPLFLIDDRGTSLFCQVGYFGPPEGLHSGFVNGREVDLSQHLVLVSIENAIHQTIGYHLDTGIVANARGRARIPLSEVHDRLLAAVAAMDAPSASRAA